MFNINKNEIFFWKLLAEGLVFPLCGKDGRSQSQPNFSSCIRVLTNVTVLRQWAPWLGGGLPQVHKKQQRSMGCQRQMKITSMKTVTRQRLGNGQAVPAASVPLCDGAEYVLPSQCLSEEKQWLNHIFVLCLFGTVGQKKQAFHCRTGSEINSSFSTGLGNTKPCFLA